MATIKEFYRIPAPYSVTDEVVVYGEPEMGSYEWRIEAEGKVKKDTVDHGYGCAEIALRDALVDASSD